MNIYQCNAMQYFCTSLLMSKSRFISFLEAFICKTTVSISTISTSAETKPWTTTINPPNLMEVSHSFLLQEYAAMKTLKGGRMVHAHMIKTGTEAVFLNNMLANIYAKCGTLMDARKVFDKMPQRDVVSWNGIIAGYVHQGGLDEALNLFIQMQRFQMKPDMFTFGSVLKACSSLMDLEFGSMVHGCIIRTGFEDHSVVGCGLVDMYAKCYDIELARKLFDKMPYLDLIVANAMIAGYVHNGYDGGALQLFCQLQGERIEGDSLTFSSVLSACANLEAMEQGKLIHAHQIKTQIVREIPVENALITMYAKGGSLECACKMFETMPVRNAVSWNSVITGCAHLENIEAAFRFFSEMQESGMRPNEFTFAVILKVCSSVLALEQGKQTHASVIKSRFQSDVIVSGALLDMYAKCSSLEDALLLFENLVKPTVVSWSAMISAYARNGLSEHAVKLFSQMQLEGMEPNKVTFVSVLMACANLASLKGGTQIHAWALKSQDGLDVSVGNALVDMYAKCGSIHESRKVFDRMHHQDVISWTTMITGYSQHGHVEEVVQLFEKMRSMGMKPDHITFVSVISACNHAGLVNEGIGYYRSMIEEYGIPPREEHYNCVADLLSRAGLLDEALNFIAKMPFEPGALVWGSLLAACRIHRNMELAKHAADRVVELEPHRSGSYVQLSNIYAAAGRWEEKAKIVKIMKEKGVKKDTGKSWIDIKNKIHTFSTGDTSHPEAEQIYAKLEELTAQMKQAGYIPNTNFVLPMNE